MIRLREAKFTNFRGLRDVQIDFAPAGEPALTVIRAENATGKTSMLYGLTWALFGEAGLPVSARRRDTYRISPVNWNAAESGCEIPVEVTVRITVGDDDVAEDYEIVRRATETVNDDGSFEWTASTVVIYKETDRGTVVLPNPTTFLELELLPVSLKDIFFLDGDEALKDYVNSARDDTRRNVRDAVRSLLGLEILEAAQGHLGDVRRTIAAAVKSESTGDLARVTERMLTLDDSIKAVADELVDLDTDVKNAENLYQSADRQRTEVLSNGGQQTKELEQQERAAELAAHASEIDQEERIKQQRALLATPDLLHVVCRRALLEASEEYEALRSGRKIPNTLPELIEERLRQRVCICGASLEPGTEGHAHMTAELEESSRYDQAHHNLTELAALALSAIASSEPGARGWFTQSADNIKAYLTAKKANEDSLIAIRELQTRIRNTSRAGDFETADSRRTSAENNRREAYAKLTRRQSDLASQQRDRDTLRKQYEALQRKETRFRRRLAEQAAVKDMLDVIAGTIGVLQDETVQSVGTEMNAIFQEMVAAAPGELDATPEVVVKEVVLTKECDILVLGPLGREIVPSNGLSGAQRRALTVAFILALTKISGVRAPLVIDTPLGMTSGTIRRSLLENTLKNSQQIVLFLTRAEIEGVEDILDRYARLNYTMTNTQHAVHAANPSFAVGRPMEVILCRCQHDVSCDICARNEAS